VVYSQAKATLFTDLDLPFQNRNGERN
jgi:hypothetical protein